MVSNSIDSGHFACLIGTGGGAGPPTAHPAAAIRNHPGGTGLSDACLADRDRRRSRSRSRARASSRDRDQSRIR